ncbi:MAG TPA: AbrB/MazE/SpoVT family DNA-binding domain-containing protein [Bryobacteraceae bacterium]|jgi:antitoxin MazE|nr:AbrB/MazE/SpoVT family DNA-binding domain-containing protein [Bryobacteraceae bacterium]
MKASVQRWGNSLALRIPKAIAVESGLANGSVVELTLRKGFIALIPERPRKHRLKELLSRVTTNNLHGEVTTSVPVGKEIW